MSDVVRTERLTLRPLAEYDLEAYARINTSSEGVRFLPGGAERAAKAEVLARKALAYFARCRRECGYAPWAVVRNCDGRVIGHGGLHFVSERRETELLYLLDREAWGCGYATETGRAAISYARQALGLRRLCAYVVPENVRSLRVLERLGFADAGALRIFEIDARCYELLLAQRPPG